MRAILLWATPVGLRPTGLHPVLQCYEATVSSVSDNNNNNRLTAFVPGQPGYAGTRRNTLPSALA